MFYDFRALFTYDTSPSVCSNETSRTSTNLDHAGLTEETFKEILDFIYTSNIKLNEDNIQGILQVWATKHTLIMPS